jgi:hypothetical protein
MRRGLIQEVFEAIGGLQHLLLTNNIVCHVEFVPLVRFWSMDMSLGARQGGPVH